MPANLQKPSSEAFYVEKEEGNEPFTCNDRRFKEPSNYTDTISDATRPPVSLRQEGIPHFDA